jgi:hypothetical protein
VYSLDEANNAAADGWVVTGFSEFINTGDNITPHRDTEIYLMKHPKK